MSFRDRLLYTNGQLRPGLKIALFFLLFLLFAAAAQYVITVLPRHPLQWGSLVAMTLAALLAGWILLSGIDRRPFGALGFPIHRATLPELLGGLAIGSVLIGAAVLLLVLTGSAAFAPDSGTLPGYLGFLGWTFLFFGIAAAFEELVFRGYAFQALVAWIGPWPAIVIASAIFAALHGQNPNVTSLAIVNIFVAGVLLSLAYLKTRSLWFATGVHVGWNWTMAT
ncbi:MAG TPA: CPBP family intramembrane glutamic endopeptidase, partial [Longimicrobiaceae bacterium]|nr:CPBP family intramembrane glutamic endopeptidase [Longimicrobiaceae bacterium]